MKFKNVILGVALLVANMSFGQEKGDMSAFVGAVYPLETGAKPGVNAGFEYMFTDEISFAPSFSYYFTDGATLTAINADVRYYLGGSDSLKYFGTAGWRRSTASANGFSVSANGYNAGGGLLYSLSDSMDVIVQARYSGSNGSGGFEPMAGISFKF